MALGEYVASLHGSCDFLLENFEVCEPYSDEKSTIARVLLETIDNA